MLELDADPSPTKPNFKLGVLREADMGVAQNIQQEGQTAGVGPCFHLPGINFGTVFFSHSHILSLSKGWGAANRRFCKPLASMSRWLLRCPRRGGSREGGVLEILSRVPAIGFGLSIFRCGLRRLKVYLVCFLGCVGFFGSGLRN